MEVNNYISVVMSDKALREGYKKNVKVWSLTKEGGGQPEPHPYCKNNFFLK